MDNGKEMTPEQESSDATHAPVTAIATAPAGTSTAKPSTRKARATVAKVKTTKVAKPAAVARAAKPASQPAKVDEATGKQQRRRYTPQEKSQLLEDINRQVQAGGTVKSALELVGLSLQTYYLWRRALKSSKPLKSSKGQNGKADVKLDDLASLEKENARLKRLLAEQLAKENAALKSRLRV